MKRLNIHASAVSFAVLLTAYTAAAQQQGTAAASFGAQGQAAAAAPTPAPPPPPPPTGVAAEPAPAPAAQQNQAGMPLPAAANANAPTGNSEHDDMVGHLAVGFLGRSSIPYGATAAGDAVGLAPAPVVGIRYWFDPLIGLDVGLGLWVGGRSTDTTPPAGGATTTVSGPKPTALVIHGGLPLALASSKHFAFQIIPEANFGFASVTQDGNPTKYSGTHFDIGARVGGEVHFGFIGVPQLSLIGSVGLRFEYDKLSTENNAVPQAANVSSGNWSLSTTTNESPWNIFVTNVGALYYL
jgi:hypothetical protein